MKFSKLQGLISKINNYTELDDDYVIPTSVGVTAGWREAYQSLKLDDDQLIFVERVNQQFSRRCKVKLSLFSFKKEGLDIVESCRTLNLFIIHGKNDINHFFKEFIFCQDFSKALSKVKNQKITYREPSYYKESEYFLSIEDYEWMEEEGGCDNISLEDCYKLYLDQLIETNVSFDADSPFSIEDYKIIDEWVELKPNEKIENNQIYSKAIHGRVLSDLSVDHDGYTPHGDESKPYIKEIVIGNKLVSKEVFFELATSVVDL